MKSFWWKTEWLFIEGWQCNDYAEINEALGAARAIIDGQSLPTMHLELKNNYWRQTFWIGPFNQNDFHPVFTSNVKRSVQMQDEL